MARAPREEPTRALTDALDGAEAGWELVILDGPQAGAPRGAEFFAPIGPGQQPRGHGAADRLRGVPPPPGADGERRSGAGQGPGLHQRQLLRGHPLREPGPGPGGGVPDRGDRAPGGGPRAGRPHAPPSEETSFGKLLGKSRKMRAVFAVLERAARTDATVLISGETGTGKEVVAEAIHAASARKERPFVVVDCASIPLQPHRVRALRAREGRVHQRHDRPHRRLRGGGRRHHLPGRAGRAPAGVADPASSGCWRPGASSGWGQRLQGGGRPGHRRHQPRPGGRGPGQALPERPLLPPRGDQGDPPPRSGTAETTSRS
jgi:hypothetical protein